MSLNISCDIVFSNRANRFDRVYPFGFNDICVKQELASGYAFIKKSVLFRTGCDRCNIKIVKCSGCSGMLFAIDRNMQLDRDKLF